MVRLIVNKKATVEETVVRIKVRVFSPHPAAGEIRIRDEKKLLDDTYGILAGAMATYLCSAQIRLEENPESGIKYFKVLSKHMAIACTEATQIDSGPIATKTEKPERSFLIAYQ